MSKAYGQRGSWSVTSKIIATGLKIVSPGLVVMAMTLLLTSCAHDFSGRPASASPQAGILRLRAGSTYLAAQDEVWYSAARFDAAERDTLNAVAALKQCQNSK